MTFKTTIAAAMIGLATIAGATSATAAPLAAPALKAEANITTVGNHGGKRHGHRHGKRHGHRHGHGHKRHWGHIDFRPDCFRKKVRVWSHYRHGWIYTYETVCYRGGRRY